MHLHQNEYECLFSTPFPSQCVSRHFIFADLISEKLYIVYISFIISEVKHLSLLFCFLLRYS